jgi:hypothetical protein
MACLVTAFMSQARAADSTNNTARIEQRLRKIELVAVLQQYERVQTAMQSAIVDQRLLQVDDNITGDDLNKKSQKIQRRIMILTEIASELSDKAKTLAEPITVAKIK